METRPTPVSSTLAINETVAAMRESGRDVVHLGFGEAGLPLHPLLTEALRAGVHDNRYAPVLGLQTTQSAAVEYFHRRGLRTTEETVAIAPGSKALLGALIHVLPGEVVLPAPSWVSYAAQVALAGKQVHWVPTPDEAGGVPDPDALETALKNAVRAGGNPKVMVLTLPDNPTGTVASRSLLERVCEVAQRHNLVIVSDEIYRDVLHPGVTKELVSPAHIMPDRTVVTTGLSKNLALGGWRLGIAAFPDTPEGAGWRASVAAYASEVWSSASAPVQHAATFALSEPAALSAHIQSGAHAYEAVMGALYGALENENVTCRAPQAGFYLYPEITRVGARAAQWGVSDSITMEKYLLTEHGIAVLGGHNFGDDTHRLAFRIAASMLFGETEEERWETISVEDPAMMPNVQKATQKLREAITAITRDS